MILKIFIEVWPKILKLRVRGKLSIFMHIKNIFKGIEIFC